MKTGRRVFLKQMTALTAAAAMPGVITNVSAASKNPPRKVKPGRKVRMACVGIGNRGKDVFLEFEKTGLCEFVAFCDIDMGAPQTLDVIDKYPSVPRFQDFRKMFKEMGKKIDAVSVSTPDHSHFPVCILAMSLGINVFVEKPLAHSFYQCELLMEAEKKYGVVTQMGNQGHSEENYFQFKIWKEAGIIRNVRSITAHMNNPRRWHEWDYKMQSFFPEQEVPATLDWDSWLCGEMHHPFNQNFVNGQWRCWYDFGMGALGDWGAHIIDTAHEFLELGLPTEINMLRAEGHNPFFYPYSSTIEFKFPARGDMPPVDITWYDGLDNIPPVPEGYGNVELDPNIPLVAGGKIQPAKLNPGKIIYSDELTFKGGSHGSPLKIIPESKAKEWESRLPEVPDESLFSNHYKNFLLACQGLEEPRSPFSVSGPLSQVFCLGVIAQQLNARLKFDPETKLFTNNPVANLLLRRGIPRKGWEEFYLL